MKPITNGHARCKVFSLLLSGTVALLLPLPSLANKAVLAPAGKNAQAGKISAICATQQHHSIGKGDLYLSGQNVKYVFNDGDLVCLYRGGEQKVYLSCPAKKSVFVSSLSDYRRRGLLFTSTGHSACETSNIKDDNQAIEFQKMRAKTYSIYSVAASRSGEIRMLYTGKITALTQPIDAGVAEFISISYAIPLIRSLPLEMKMRYSAPDASLWFKTNPKDLPRSETAYSRLRTMKIANVKVAPHFFDAPLSFKKVSRQEYILNMASATKDFTDLMLP